MKGLSVLLILTLAISCGKKEEKNSELVRYGEALQDKRELTSAEVERIQGMCEALAFSERRLDNLTDNGRRFRFQRETKNCKGENEKLDSAMAEITIPFDGKAPFFKNLSEGDLISTLVTSDYYLFKKACAKEISHNQWQEGDIFYRMRILKSDHLEVIHYKKENDGKWYPRRVEEVVVQLGGSDSIKGLIKKHVQATFCSNGQLSYFKQTL